MSTPSHDAGSSRSPQFAGATAAQGEHTTTTAADRLSVHHGAPGVGAGVGAGFGAGQAFDRDINVNVAAQRGDQVRWGPVWAGVTVALPTFLLGTLVFLALGVLDTDGVSGTTGGIVTGLIALGALFLGGLTAAATAMWRGLSTGLLHGILVWALSIVAILALTLLGGGAVLGSAGNIASQLVDPATVSRAVSGADASDVPEVSPADQEQAREAGQSAASYAVLGLGLTFIAAAAGGLVGAKFWPRKKDLKSTTTTTR
ncbi:permease [Kineococcus sp. SYSU DK005]|uniref:permease n=1 Tax=Kineococcus sp. SYSU DK005 TaxID=3383126 RepID=UPI003D7EE9BF